MSRSPNAAVLFAALGDATRLSLLRRLSVDGPLSITRLSEGTGVTRQAITKHLNTLGNVGLVRHARRDPTDARPRVEPGAQRVERPVVRGHRALGEAERRTQELAA